MEMMRTVKSTLFLAVLTAIVLSGCVMTGPSSGKDKNKIPPQLIFPPPPDEPRYYFERSIHSSADVTPDTEADKLRRALTGERQRGQGMAKPYGIAVHHGRIFVGDTVLRNVAVFDIPEQKFFRIGEFDDDQGHGKLYMPMGLAVDKTGTLYVLDAKLQQVIVYDRDGKFLRSIGNPDDIKRPAGIAVDPDGKRVYAVDIGGSSTESHKILVYDAVSGQHLFDISKRGTLDGYVNLPRDADVGLNGDIYVVDSGNFRVQEFSPDGKFVSKFGAIGRQPGQFSRPKELAHDSHGNIYVVDAAFGNFQIFDTKGELLLAIGNRSNDDGPALFALPAGIAIDGDDRIYVVDQYFRKVDIFRPAALDEDDGYIGKNAIEKFATGGQAPSSPQPKQPASNEPGTAADQIAPPADPAAAKP